MESSKTILFLMLCLSISACNQGGSEGQDASSANPKVEVDVCKCLTMPGNSTFMQENADACRDAISAQLGVANWEQVNMSENPDISERFDRLAARCTGAASEIDKLENQTDNSEGTTGTSGVLFENIGTGSGFIYEHIDQSLQMYVTLAFDDGSFRNTAYNMNGQTDSKRFTEVIRFEGDWNPVNDRKAVGVISGNGASVSWAFSRDYETLTNNKGVEYKRVKVR